MTDLRFPGAEELAELVLAKVENSRLRAALQRCCDESDYCYACDNHPSHGHTKGCPLGGEVTDA